MKSTVQPPLHDRVIVPNRKLPLATRPMRGMATIRGKPGHCPSAPLRHGGKVDFAFQRRDLNGSSDGEPRTP
jgi:hypothetical protein